MISINDFCNTQLCIATILDVAAHPNADRLYVLRIDLGDEERSIVAGIKSHYTEEQLIGRQIVIVANLEPAVIRGEKSQGMLLAGKTEEKVILLSPLEQMPNGTRLG